ncbi:M1 family peptidase [Elizabethkingia argentiflava]|uniref:M1 family peptidase n=1 Tax=Elizabethkingia argenteiflava TaxID=2681556 RepID=A0A845PWF1_9FLAO|nr:M1 family metallopeptidase [Elizabethkingia argenteiflava]NAW50648.1 M1 family peptidase [Elizabethkingia argenteiflava]
MGKNLLAGILIFVFVLGFSQKGAYYQQKAKYKIDVDIDVNNFTYEGQQDIEYTNNSPDELNVIYMHLYWNAFKSGSMMDQRVRSQAKNGDKRLQKGGISRLANIPPDQEGFQHIHWVTQNGKPVKFEIQETLMKVYLNETIPPGSSTVLSMEWDAHIPMQIRRSGRNNKEGIDLTMTQWYPKISEYDYDGWATFDYIGREFHAPFSDFDVHIKIDKNYIIGAGGQLENPSEVLGYTSSATINADQKNKVVWKWTAKNILDFAWAADRDYSVEEFSVLGGPKVYFVYQKSDKTKYWEEAKSYVTKFFQMMETQFGAYAWPNYTFIQGGDGGMEYGMCSIILGETDSLKNLCDTMFHEGAHSWYQQMLATNESVRPWMDEGFASYAQHYILNQLFPPLKPEPNPFINTLYDYRKFIRTGKEEPASWLGDHHDDGTAYTYASYIKGELFLVQLGYIMGEQNLSKVLKQYYEEWNMKHPTDRDFMHIAQKISGMDLKWFHNYWINTTKTIDYSIKSVKYNIASTTITLVNNGSLPMPIDFNILTKNREILTFHIPLNMMRTPKEKDIYGSINVMPYWNWTQKEYEITVPYTKSQIQAMGIDFSQRLADVNPEDNIIEVK